MWTRVLSGHKDGPIQRRHLTLRDELPPLREHTDWVWRIVPSPSLSKFATVSHDRSVNVWETETETLVMTLRGHTGEVHCAVWLSETSLATGSSDRTVRVWDVAAQASTAVLAKHKQTVWDLAVNSERTLLASSSWDCSVVVWRVPSLQKLRRILADTLCYAVAFQPLTADVLAVGLGSGKIQLHSATLGERIDTLGGHTSNVIRMAFSDDGALLASGSYDNTARIHDVDSARLLHTLPHPYDVYGVCFVPAGAGDAETYLLVTGCADDAGTINVFDALTGVLQQSCQTGSVLTALAVLAFDPDTAGTPGTLESTGTSTASGPVTVVTSSSGSHRALQCPCDVPEPHAFKKGICRLCNRPIPVAPSPLLGPNLRLAPENAQAVAGSGAPHTDLAQLVAQQQAQIEALQQLVKTQHEEIQRQQAAQLALLQQILKAVGPRAGKQS
eukprot:TRINITY_DN1466_c0_g1_i1.p1 TRINITY_DN1466_c0_g1~~TRINITY_DN1466_c0_g1_i1.p1  ORF type:complete len:444 (+),score=104.00 TRINITY_DN1466_c0_g1_i1:122-1453(+)